MVKVMTEEKLIDPTRGKSTLDARGREDHSKSGGQLAAAVNVIQRDNLGERVRALIKSEKLALEAERAGYETFEEADDLDVAEDDTFDPKTPYEDIFEGSVVDDVAARFQEQKERLRTLKADKLKEFLAGMDPAELQVALTGLVPAASGTAAGVPAAAPVGAKGSS